MPEKIHKITLSGSPDEIGYQHGVKLARQIHHNIEFYRPLFLTNFETETQVLHEAKHIKDRIQNFNPAYIVELDHIALGAEVTEPLWVYALNSRTELTLTRRDGECTALVFPKQNFLGQTWDWAQSLSDSFVIMQINYPSGHQILQLTEAGIIGKIGLNNQGLGVTLNILWTKDLVLSGIPVHILLRAILDSRSLEDSSEVVNRSLRGKASNIIVCQDGSAYDVEFLGGHAVSFDITQPAYVHTNHYKHINDPAMSVETESESSETRHNKALSEFRNLQQFDLRELVSILSDSSDGEKSILSAFKPDKHFEMGACGTLATIAMDLGNAALRVRKGNPSVKSYTGDGFVEFSLGQVERVAVE